MIIPTSEQEVSHIIRDATAPMRIMGGGTRDVGNPVAGDTLSMSGLSGVSLYEPGALTLVAKAGTPLSEVKDLLAKDGQRLPFEPMDHRALLGTDGSPTIGGMAAANISGPRRVQVGACRDFMIGVRFVDGTGAVVKNGGRVMKNVTGYDLVKLMAGSHGTLGVLTEVAFKVLARPETQATLVHYGKSAADAVAAMSAALGSPFDVSGAGYLAGPERTQVRVEGMVGSVGYRSKKLLDVLPGFEIVEGDKSHAMWRELRDVLPFAAKPGAVWRVSVKPSDGPSISDALQDADVAHDAIYDWGGGLVWVLVEDVGDCAASLIRGHIAKLGGHATLVRASHETRANVPVLQPQNPTLAAISTGLRAKFDPRGLFNPGLMG